MNCTISFHRFADQEPGDPSTGHCQRTAVTGAILACDHGHSTDELLCTSHRLRLEDNHRRFRCVDCWHAAPGKEHECLTHLVEWRELRT